MYVYIFIYMNIVFLCMYVYIFIYVCISHCSVKMAMENDESNLGHGKWSFSPDYIIIFSYIYMICPAWHEVIFLKKYQRVDTLVSSSSQLDEENVHWPDIPSNAFCMSESVHVTFEIIWIPMVTCFAKCWFLRKPCFARSTVRVLWK